MRATACLVFRGTSVTASDGRPAWLTADDELPHPGEPDSPPTWSENYLSYVWSPENGVGIYVHLARRISPFEVWDEVVNIALPGDRFVTAKSFGPCDSGGLGVAAVRMACEVPYERWTKRFVGAGRLMDGDTYRAGPVTDGLHTPMRWELSYTAMSPPFDFGTEHLDQAWGHGHYEQHGMLEGWLEIGDERFEIEGTGLRDHSWGPRDYHEIGTTTWLHAQFPASGRAVMAVLVTGRPPRPPFSVATITDSASVRHLQADALPQATTLEDTSSAFRFALRDGLDSEAEISVEVLRPLRAACAGSAELVLGTHAAPAVNHHYIDAFSRFTWDGEIGYGLTERTVDIETC
ncbi:hypothetical protein MycrhDRAFT_1557 [Mycolicibacterium rhodesiae JS60]|nr:hypothetical protein MycrhDRAFT_1557 [Mycolicibacterium rhodesiae JS60]